MAIAIAIIDDHIVEDLRIEFYAFIIITNIYVAGIIIKNKYTNLNYRTMKTETTKVVTSKIVELCKFTPAIIACEDCGVSCEDTYILPTKKCKGCQEKFDMYYYNVNTY